MFPDQPWDIDGLMIWSLKRQMFLEVDVNGCGTVNARLFPGSFPRLVTINKDQLANMPAPRRTTVDRLDKPSAYYLGRVCFLNMFYFRLRERTLTNS